MAKLCSEVSLVLQGEPDPARAVGRLNRHLCETGNEERFVTFLLAVIDGESHELTVVNAGHMDPIVRRSDGRVEALAGGADGTPLGTVEGRRYEPVRTVVGPGDVVVLYTDGISDATDAEGRSFGGERLRRAIAQAPGSAASVGEAILAAIGTHDAGQPQFDDMTLVCIERS
jgi:sigma-B regulation protein RsbU (phosphoserine phosphatase)